MVGNGQVPGGPGDITPEWLTGVLREGGHLPEGVVSAVALEPIAADRGFTGVVSRIRPTYDGAAGAPASLVAKLPTARRESPSAYRLAQGISAEAARRHFERCATEVAFYREVAPDGGCAVPRVYHAVTDPERLSIVLLLEDLSAGTDGDGLAGCTPAQAKALLEAVAPLHARMWQRPAPGWAAPFVTDPLANQQSYASRVEPFLARHGPALSPEVRGLLRRLQSNYAAVLAELNRTPHTLMHGDLHLDNVVFFDDPDTDRPAVVLDWQGVRRGPAAVDVASMLFEALNADDRREAEEWLLRHYLALLSVNGVANYSLGQLRKDCRLALLCQVVGKVGWLADTDPDELSSREQDLLAAAFGDGRLVTALRDYGLT
jgi:aminoglycoside/choline kinase family phosphotransferase